MGHTSQGGLRWQRNRAPAPQPSALLTPREPQGGRAPRFIGNYLYNIQAIAVQFQRTGPRRAR